jgi:hypothetical protein
MLADAWVHNVRSSSVTAAAAASLIALGRRLLPKDALYQAKTSEAPPLELALHSIMYKHVTPLPRPAVAMGKAPGQVNIISDGTTACGYQTGFTTPLTHKALHSSTERQ